MQSRIDQMVNAWNHLELLKSVRAQRPHQGSVSPVGALPEPAFDKLPAMPIIGIVKPTRGAVSDASTSSTDASSGSGLASTPPRLTSNRIAKISSSVIELPELPKYLTDDDFSGSRTPSPPVSPRAGEAAVSPRGSHVKNLRKKASKRFSQIKLDLSELAKKMSPRGGRSSPEKTSPVRKVTPRRDDPRLSALPVAERQRIAVEMAAFCLGDEYKKAGPARQSLLFNGKLIGLLDAFPAMVNDNALKALRADLDWRMRHACLDVVVDLNEERFAASVKKEIDGRFIRTWGNEKAGEEGEQAYPEVKGKMTKTFLRDFPMTSHVLKFDDGRREKIDHPVKLMEFIGPGIGGDLPHIISHVANQNLTAFLNTVLFRRASDDGKFDSVIKLWDGCPVTPRGNMRPSCIYSKDSEGNIILDFEYYCTKETSPNNLGMVDANNSFDKKSAHDHAELRVSVRVKFAPDGEWEINDPHVIAKGWNVPADD